jgi:hypothetical protein
MQSSPSKQITQNRFSTSKSEFTFKKIVSIQTIVLTMSNNPNPKIVNLDSDTEEDKKASPKEEDPPPTASGITTINPFGAPLKKTPISNYGNIAYIYHVRPDIIDKTSSTPNALVPAPIRGLCIVVKGTSTGEYQFWHAITNQAQGPEIINQSHVLSNRFDWGPKGVVEKSANSKYN